jgi:hypothetical protein
MPIVPWTILGNLALMHALVRFANVAAANTFTTSQLHAPTAEALGYTLWAKPKRFWVRSAGENAASLALLRPLRPPPRTWPRPDLPAHQSGLNKATKNAMCAPVNSKYKDQILRSLRKRANRFGFEVVELPKATQPRRSGSLRVVSKKKAFDEVEHSSGIKNSSDPGDSRVSQAVGTKALAFRLKTFGRNPVFSLRLEEHSEPGGHAVGVIVGPANFPIVVGEDGKPVVPARLHACADQQAIVAS